MSKHFVLVPGFWLGGWAWDDVAAELQDRGHSVTAVTLPGLHDAEEGRASISWSDQVDALAAIVQQASAEVVLVAHSGGGFIASGVLDRDPRSVERVIYVDSGPATDGTAFDAELEPDLAEVLLPSFPELSARGASLEGIPEDRLSEFRRRAVPEPGRVVHDTIHLDNDGRRDVASTLVCCSIDSATVQRLAEQGHPMFAEVAALRDVTFLDLPTGHWPMFSRPRDLAEALVTATQVGDSAHSASSGRAPRQKRAGST
jgi:pimeloyl-ACP methyl ester carboxylesterase